MPAAGGAEPPEKRDESGLGGARGPRRRLGTRRGSSLPQALMLEEVGGMRPRGRRRTLGSRVGSPASMLPVRGPGPGEVGNEDLPTQALIPGFQLWPRLCFHLVASGQPPPLPGHQPSE